MLKKSCIFQNLGNLKYNCWIDQAIPSLGFNYGIKKRHWHRSLSIEVCRACPNRVWELKLEEFPHRLQKGIVKGCRGVSAGDVADETFCFCNETIRIPVCVFNENNKLPIIPWVIDVQLLYYWIKSEDTQNNLKAAQAEHTIPISYALSYWHCSKFILTIVVDRIAPASLAAIFALFKNAFLERALPCWLRHSAGSVFNIAMAIKPT